MNTDTRRKASAEFHARRTAAGWKKVTVWLPPEALAQLAKLKAAHGSNDAAVHALLAQPKGVKIDVATGTAPRPKMAAKEAPLDDVAIGPQRPAPGSLLKKGR